jgi:hypothetical protein
LKWNAAVAETYCAVDVAALVVASVGGEVDGVELAELVTISGVVVPSLVEVAVVELAMVKLPALI